MKCCSRKQSVMSDDVGLGLRKHKGHGMRLMLFGMLVGLVVGLLFAPRPGTETINRLAEKRGKAMEKLIRRLPV